MKTVEPQPVLSLSMRNINELFPVFAIGGFSVLYGSNYVLSLASLLCVRARLPSQLGGLGSNVVFVDGGNTFRLYQLDPKRTLERIYLSRAFTAHQMTALILEKLKIIVKRYSAKLAIISDIAGFYLDKAVPEYEACRVYSQVVTYFSKLAEETQIILVVTYLPHQKTKRNSFLQTVTREKANVVISLNQTKYEREFILEKHPRYLSGIVELPSETLTLDHFIGA
jgi:hypothetical protein